MENDLLDQTLDCLGCGEKFLFEAGEKKFFLAHQLPFPLHCPACRARRKQAGKEVGNDQHKL